MTAVLGIVANFTPGGRTSAAVSAVLDGAAERGATTSLLEVGTENIAEAVAAISAADAVVFGSPTYRAGYSSVLKQLLENMQRGKFAEESAPLKGTATSIVMTAASFHHYLAPEDLRAVLASFFAAQVLAPSLYLEGGSFDENKQLTAEARELARLQGAALTDLAVAVGSSPSMSTMAPLI